jgi:membrane-associated phospholipid phosphatase
LRVEAGKHFYTDVLVGAVVGSAIGVAVPMLHRKKLKLPMGLGSLRMAPMLLPDGAGLALVLR